ncbi:MAG: hypothetical protein AAF934_06935, partial [Bacteroidota bacterium]
KKQYAQQRTLNTEKTVVLSSVACIVNIDEFENVEALSSFAEALNILSAQFHIMVYTKNPGKYKHIKYPLVSLNDFNWRLRAKGDHTKTFLSKEYDVLINYFTKKQLPLLLLSNLTQAGIRIGFKALDYHYNDIIFEIDIHNDTLFKSELLKYLTILNKIENR